MACRKLNLACLRGLKETSDTDVAKVLRLHTHMKTNNGMLQTKPSMPQEIEKNNSYKHSTFGLTNKGWS